MQRKQFIQLVMGSAALSTLSGLKLLANSLPQQDATMPVLFIGHGSPMNAIENNEFTTGWKTMAAKVPTPKCILIVSAHWLTQGTKVTAMDYPQTIYDFGGFPPELSKVKYNSPGSLAFATETIKTITSTSVLANHDWGLDHGAWSVTQQMYPLANIPTLQLSIDYSKAPNYHFELAKELQALRKKGVLIICSGNMIHNLGMIKTKSGSLADINEPYGYDWALEINELLKININNGNYTALVNYNNLHKYINLAIPSLDHYLPLIYSLGLAKANADVPYIFNDKVIAGSLNMTSVAFGL
jgi:4,5-DOPA dioxygenase extradiol